MACPRSAFAIDVIRKAVKALPGLKTLSLKGKKISSTFLGFVAKLPCAANLTCVNLAGYKITGDGALCLLGATSRLTSLTLISNLCNEFFLRQLSSRLIHARQGGAPLLSELYIEKGYSEFSWSTIALLGELFPELRTFRCSSPIAKYAGTALLMKPLPRLHQLYLDHLRPSYGNVATAELGVCLGALFAACPALETLRLQHGKLYPGSRMFPSDAPALPEAALPTANGVFSALQGERLRSLTIAQIGVSEDSFANCSFPVLTTIKLLAGDALLAQRIVADLKLRCPVLTVVETEAEAPSEAAASASGRGPSCEEPVEDDSDEDAMST
jgi:hypothetical protein